MGTTLNDVTQLGVCIFVTQVAIGIEVTQTQIIRSVHSKFNCITVNLWLVPTCMSPDSPVSHLKEVLYVCFMNIIVSTGLIGFLFIPFLYNGA